MYGSDWPVCLIAADYEKQLALIENYVSKWKNTEGGKIFGDNAKKFYKI
jgi:L-fuconolactonase